MELPLSDLFSVVKIASMTLLFPLRAARDATRHFEVVTDRGHTDPVKNGDAFERLGIMTLLADSKNTGMGSDNFSLGDDREMTQLHGHSFDEGALSGVGFHRCLHIQGYFAIGGTFTEPHPVGLLP